MKLTNGPAASASALILGSTLALTLGAALGAALLSGCVAAPDATDANGVGVDVGDTAPYEIELDSGCVGAGCPGNSDLYAALGIFELSLNPAEVSARGFSLDPSNIWKNGKQLTDFKINGARPSAVNPDTHSVFVGPDLVGTTIRVVYKGRYTYDLLLDAYMTTGYYTNPLPAGLAPFHAFKIRYRKDEGDLWTDLCPYVDLFDHGMQGTWAVFWQGDRIDPVTGDFTHHDAAVGDWFNVSCAGESLIKMLRTGTGGAVNPLTTPEQRQATLDMFTARYCPGADRYTKLGQAIVWDDKTGSNKLSPGASPEAIWGGAGGAVCLSTPRLPGQKYSCAPPPCTPDMIQNWPLYGWLRSGVPLVVQ